MSHHLKVYAWLQHGEWFVSGGSSRTTGTQRASSNHPPSGDIPYSKEEINNNKDANEILPNLQDKILDDQQSSSKKKLRNDPTTGSKENLSGNNDKRLDTAALDMELKCLPPVRTPSDREPGPIERARSKQVLSGSPPKRVTSQHSLIYLGSLDGEGGAEQYYQVRYITDHEAQTAALNSEAFFEECVPLLSPWKLPQGL